MCLHTFFLKPIPIIKLIIRSASSFLLTTDTLTFVHSVQVVSLQETEPCVLDLVRKYDGMWFHVFISGIKIGPTSVRVTQSKGLWDTRTVQTTSGLYRSHFVLWSEDQLVGAALMSLFPDPGTSLQLWIDWFSGVRGGRNTEQVKMWQHMATKLLPPTTETGQIHFALLAPGFNQSRMEVRIRLRLGLKRLSLFSLICIWLYYLLYRYLNHQLSTAS